MLVSCILAASVATLGALGQGVGSAWKQGAGLLGFWPPPWSCSDPKCWTLLSQQTLPGHASPALAGDSSYLAKYTENRSWATRCFCIMLSNTGTEYLEAREG